MSFSQPLCQIDQRAAPAGHTRRTAQTPRVTLLKSHRDVIAFGCYRTRWDSHINLRMKDITFLPWKLSQKTKLTRLKRGCVSQRGPWPEPKTRFSLPIAHSRLTVEAEVAGSRWDVSWDMRAMCLISRGDPAFRAYRRIAAIRAKIPLTFAETLRVACAKRMGSDDEFACPVAQTTL